MAPLPDYVVKRLQPVVEATGQSVAQLWAQQSKATRAAAFKTQWRAFWQALSLKKQAALRNNWGFWGRPKQQIPVVAFFIWLILAGRGWGKSRTGAQFAIEQARKRPGSIGMLLAPTAADLRDTMIHGDSGILASSPPDFKPQWEPSKLRLTWPNGSRAICRTADSPDRLRGPNLDWAWCDELAAWRYLKAAWDMLMFCLRRGQNPQVCVTTTPRAVELIKKLLEDAKNPKNLIVVTHGSSWENYWNLGKRWFDQVIAQVSGALARQEVWAEVLEKVDGALWSLDGIHRIQDPVAIQEILSSLTRIVVGVDPAEESGPDNDEVGIVAAGKDAKGHGYALEDYSLRGRPAVWARRAYELWRQLDADAIVVEKNRGGEMCEHTIRSVVREGEPMPRIIAVRAMRGKLCRAEPVAALYELKRFSHLGTLPKLEDEMVTYSPRIAKRSPNRLDALVYAVLELFPTYGIAA